MSKLLLLFALIGQKELMLINVVNLVLLVNQAEGVACRSSFSW